MNDPNPPTDDADKAYPSIDDKHRQRLHEFLDAVLDLRQGLEKEIQLADPKDFKQYLTNGLRASYPPFDTSKIEEQSADLVKYAMLLAADAVGLPARAAYYRNSAENPNDKRFSLYVILKSLLPFFEDFDRIPHGPYLHLSEVFLSLRALDLGETLELFDPIKQSGTRPGPHRLLLSGSHLKAFQWEQRLRGMGLSAMDAQERVARAYGYTGWDSLRKAKPSCVKYVGERSFNEAIQSAYERGAYYSTFAGFNTLVKSELETDGQSYQHFKRVRSKAAGASSED